MKNETIVREFARILKETQAGRAAALEREAEGTHYLRRFVPDSQFNNPFMIPTYTFTLTFFPSSPVGLISNTMISTANTIASESWVEI